MEMIKVFIFPTNTLHSLETRVNLFWRGMAAWGIFRFPAVRAVWNDVNNFPSHPNQFPYANDWQPLPFIPSPMAENVCPFSWESGSCWSDHNLQKLEVLQVLPALPEEMDRPLPCVPTGPVGNSRGLEEVVLPRGEARRLTLLHPIPSIS